MFEKDVNYIFATDQSFDLKWFALLLFSLTETTDDGQRWADNFTTDRIYHGYQP